MIHLHRPSGNGTEFPQSLFWNEFFVGHGFPKMRTICSRCGNKYRLVIKINYACAVVYVRFAGTHREYDRVNAEEI
jgi:mRNA-degrading endonuclease HigB of HigAB toxin-antitoxin module